jgi:hypothetical protein
MNVVEITGMSSIDCGGLFGRNLLMPQLKKLYVFQNPAFPYLLKIGETHDVSKRWDVLNRSSGCPEKFKVCAVYQLTAKIPSDRAIHEILAPYRNTDDREFFEITVRKVKGLLNELGLREIEPVRGHAVRSRGRLRSSNTTLKNLDLKGGESLYLKNYPRIRARISETGRIIYKRVIMTAAEAAKKAREDAGAPLVSAVNGNTHWCLKGGTETLFERRKRLDQRRQARMKAA